MPPYGGVGGLVRIVAVLLECRLGGLHWLVCGSWLRGRAHGSLGWNMLIHDLRSYPFTFIAFFVTQKKGKCVLHYLGLDPVGPVPVRPAVGGVPADGEAGAAVARPPLRGRVARVGGGGGGGRAVRGVLADDDQRLRRALGPRVRLLGLVARPAVARLDPRLGAGRLALPLLLLGRAEHLLQLLRGLPARGVHGVDLLGDLLLQVRRLRSKLGAERLDITEVVRHV